MSRGTNPSNPDNVTPDGDEDILQDEELTDGGISLSINKNNRMTPAKVRVVLDITLNANPQLAVFPGLTKTLPPGSDEIIDKIMEEALKEPPPSGPITM